MVNEERVRHMIKMAVFDKYDGKSCKPMTQYSRRDYVSMQMLRSLITGTIAFVILLGLWALYQAEYLMEELTKMDVGGLLTSFVLGYVIFLLLYELITYIVAQKRYSAGRKKVKLYFNNIRKVNQIYKREERIKMSAAGKRERA